ncbi:hypothetical protein [Thermodesulfobium sp.]|jgi:hypothetical protein
MENSEFEYIENFESDFGSYVVDDEEREVKIWLLDSDREEDPDISIYYDLNEENEPWIYEVNFSFLPQVIDFIGIWRDRYFDELDSYSEDEFDENYGNLVFNLEIIQELLSEPSEWSDNWYEEVDID